MSKAFVGRKYELKELVRLTELRMASLSVLSGRRRIGKSRLISHFAKSLKGYQFYKFNALAPREGITAQHQRDEFMRQFHHHFDVPISGISDWGDLFRLLARQTAKGKVVILFDEISWMAKGDEDFLGKLKIAWDDHFSANPKLILFLCGSVSSWIEKNLLRSSAFLGRPTLQMRLKELPLSDCMQFWDGIGSIISAYEKFKLLAVTGGIPRYLELINPTLTAEENIKNLFFNKDSILFDEYNNIFVDIYGRRSTLYQDIIRELIGQPKTQEEIAKSLSRSRSGELGEYLEDLELGGFVTRDHTWVVKTGKQSNLSKYRLSDNYLRFALRYILPNKTLIEKGRFRDRSLTSLPGWDVMMGLQFENLVLSNHYKIIQLLGIREEDIIFDNPYFQRKTQRVPGCQVDYMIQTRQDTVYVIEIKFNREAIGMKIIDDMQEKLKNLKLPKHISKRPVLIHINGVKEQVIDSLFFAKIIDFESVLNKE